jgi:hypothetical protein
MYKPLLLGINNADPFVLYGFLIILFLGLISIAGIMVYFTGYYIIKTIRRMRKDPPKAMPPPMK